MGTTALNFHAGAGGSSPGVGELDHSRLSCCLLSPDSGANPAKVSLASPDQKRHPPARPQTWELNELVVVLEPLHSGVVFLLEPNKAKWQRCYCASE